MRYATVPADVALQNFMTRKPVMIDDPDAKVVPGQPTPQIPEVLSFRRYAHAFWLNDRRWETPRARIRSLAKVVEQIEKEPGALMSFEDADHEILKEIVEKPFTAPDGSIALPSPMMQMQLEAFSDAIITASSKHPLGSAAADSDKPAKGKKA